MKVCVCHGEPMYRNNSIGGWRCAVKVRERQRPKNLVYWHREGGGYVTSRKRHLAGQRAGITERLAELEQEARRLAEQRHT